ncbi:MAG: hypothetical protein K6D38_07160 [Pseudobutyrivibrio sp.]|nr:hypothetical protein [Pseudobutyrivibrio sp.]
MKIKELFNKMLHKIKKNNVENNNVSRENMPQWMQDLESAERPYENYINMWRNSPEEAISANYENRNIYNEARLSEILDRANIARQKLLSAKLNENPNYKYKDIVNLKNEFKKTSSSFESIKSFPIGEGVNDITMMTDVLNKGHNKGHNKEPYYTINPDINLYKSINAQDSFFEKKSTIVSEPYKLEDYKGQINNNFGRANSI